MKGEKFEIFWSRMFETQVRPWRQA